MLLSESHCAQGGDQRPTQETLGSERFRPEEGRGVHLFVFLCLITQS